MTAKDLAAPFEVAVSTASSKAAQIKKMLKIDYSRAEWCLPSEAARNPLLWMVSIDGVVFDARMLPVEMLPRYRNGIIDELELRKRMEDREAFCLLGKHRQQPSGGEAG